MAPHMTEGKQPVLAIFGPTASGKSAVAEAVAERIPAEIVSADSMQVYRGLPVLTNQPVRPTRLVAIWELDHEASVGEYQRLAVHFDDPGLDEVERARRWFVRVNQSISHLAGRGRPSGWAAAFNTNGADHAHKFAALADRLDACAQRLRRVHLEQRPAVEVIAKYAKPGADAVLYCDPPYLDVTRSPRTRRRGGDYAVEYATGAEHRALAEVLHATPAAVLLSGYPSPLYEQLYAGWYRVEQTVQRPTSNTAGGRGSVAVEVVWSNRPLATQLELPTAAASTWPGGPA